MIQTLEKKLSCNEKQWAMLSILSQLGCVDSVDFAFYNHTKELWMQPDHLLGHGLCDAGIEKALNFVRAMSKKGENVMVRLERGRLASLIMLDDLSVAQALSIVEKGNFNHILVVTSINKETCEERTHLWLQTDRPVSELERKQIQQVMINRFGADDGSKSGEHFGRMVGFRNHKRNGQWVNLHQYQIDGIALPTDELLDMHPDNQIQTWVGLPFSPPTGGGALVSSLFTGTPTSSSKPVIERSGYKKDDIPIFKFACESLRKRMAEDKILAGIANEALLRKVRRTEGAAIRYAHTTLENAKSAVNK